MTTRASRATLCSTNMSRGAAHQAGATGPGDHLHRQNAVPTQIEKRVVDPDPLEPEYLGVDAGQNLLCGGGRGTIPIDVLIFRGWQGAGVEFCRRPSAAAPAIPHRGRHHIRRQPLGQHSADLGGV